jgi:hypothetical protein
LSFSQAATLDYGKRSAGLAQLLLQHSTEAADPHFYLADGTQLQWNKTMNETDEILFAFEGDHVAVITLNRPRVRNAVNAAPARRLDEAVKRVEQDRAIRVAILTSSNDRVFCAGADLPEIAAGRTESLIAPDGGFAGFVDHARSKPWIAAVRG